MSTWCRQATRSGGRIGPFSGAIVGDALYGRGAVDMKGGVAAAVAASLRHLDRRPDCALAFLITGDEEGPAVNGTAKLLDWARERGEIFAQCILGEPTNTDRLGDTVKIGRRGSLSGTITVRGIQGHVAYPHLARNPVKGMLALLSKLMGASARRRNLPLRPIQSRGDDGRCRQQGLQRDPGGGARLLQHPLQ